MTAGNTFFQAVIIGQINFGKNITGRIQAAQVYGFGQSGFNLAPVVANAQTHGQRSGPFDKSTRIPLTFFFTDPADFVGSQGVGAAAVIF